jgi:hypothetical protein
MWKYIMPFVILIFDSFWCLELYKFHRYRVNVHKALPFYAAVMWEFIFKVLSACENKSSGNNLMRVVIELCLWFFSPSHHDELENLWNWTSKGKLSIWLIRYWFSIIGIALIAMNSITEMLIKILQLLNYWFQCVELCLSFMHINNLRNANVIAIINAIVANDSNTYLMISIEK